MKLKVGSDPFRVWIEDEDTTLDDPDHIHLHFRIDDTGAKGMSKKLKHRLLAIGETMVDAVNREHGS